MPSPRLLLGLLALTLWFSPLSAAEPSTAEAAAEPGFVRLFNGENFQGWTLKIRGGEPGEAARVFTVGEGGTVHVFKDYPDGFELNTGNSYTHGLMYTERSYSRYHFRFQYRWGQKRLNNFAQFQYDAGAYYHVSNHKIWPWGIEYQVRFNSDTGENHTGDFWMTRIGGQWFSDASGHFFQAPWAGGQPTARRSGEHRAPLEVPYHALDGEWNQCEIIVMGDRYTLHKLNGQVVNYAENLDNDRGLIGLQSETAEIFYRNIEIKEFDSFIPVERFLPPAE